MEISEIVKAKGIKAMEKRALIVAALQENGADVTALQTLCAGLDDKQVAIILEAIEAITQNKAAEKHPVEYLLLAEKYIVSASNSAKREASRIVGNLAQEFPDKLETCIPKLLENSKDEGTVVRWGSAYALSRVICAGQYANSPLFEVLQKICDEEAENGVKNQYAKGLKKADKMRKCTL